MSADSRYRLRELQRCFASAITEPEGALEAGLDPERCEALSRLVTQGPQLSAIDRVRIYNDGYFARLQECLADDYPALSYALGELAFSSLSRAFIQEYPSRSRSLNAYGQPLAAFCRARPEPWATFAADLARLEWALVEVVHEPTSESLAPDALAKIPAERWPSARLLASPGLRVLSFDYPVNDFYQAFRDERAPQAPTRATSATAVYRQGLALWRMRLDVRAAPLLKDLVSGVPLAVALGALEARNQATGAGEELARLLPQWLGSWVQSGFFRGVEFV